MRLLPEATAAPKVAFHVTFLMTVPVEGLPVVVFSVE